MVFPLFFFKALCQRNWVIPLLDFPITYWAYPAGVFNMPFSPMHFLWCGPFGGLTWFIWFFSKTAWPSGVVYTPVCLFVLNLFGCTSLSCSIWDLVPCPEIEPRSPALRAQILAPGPPGKPLSLFEILRLRSGLRCCQVTQLLESFCHLAFHLMLFKRLMIIGLNLISLSTSRCISQSVVVSVFISWDYFIK